MTMNRTRSEPRARRRGEAGTAAVEFGLFAPLFVLLLVGLTEIGFAMFGSMQVYSAVEAGALYAIRNGYNKAGIANAVVNSTNVSGIAATPEPDEICGCPTLAGIAEATCGTTCTGGAAVGRYIRINATLTRTTILTSSFGLPATLTAQSIVRQN
jgi:Flp pilus assembly protein TadG